MGSGGSATYIEPRDNIMHCCIEFIIPCLDKNPRVEVRGYVEAGHPIIFFLRTVTPREIFPRGGKVEPLS